MFARQLLSALLLSALGVASAVFADATAQSARGADKGPFEPFSGAWTGGGQVVGANGDRERIRCRANYSQSKRGEAMTQSIVCASASYRMDIESYVEAAGGNVEGTWREATRDITGHLTGRLSDGRFSGAVFGPGFKAQISLASNGRRQEVTIQPSGGDIADVNIALERRS